MSFWTQQQLEGDMYGAQVKMLAAGALEAISRRLPWALTPDGQDYSPQGFARHIVEKAMRATDKPSLKMATDLAEWSFSWVLHGMSRVVVAPQLAASFMATSIPSEFCQHISSPWKFFAAVVPPGLLPGTSQHTVLVRSVKVDGDAPGARVLWRCMGQSRPDQAIPYVVTETWAGLAKPDLQDKFEHSEMQKTAEVVMRFVFGCVAEMQGNESVRAQVTGAPKGLPRIKRGEPKCWQVMLGRPVPVDVKHSVAAYVRGNGKTLKSQGITRGHWKWQAHGVGRALRKFIHIEPYWRGPEDAPIAVRSHVLKGPEAQT